MAKRRQTFDLEAPSHPVELYGDPVRLSQVLINLLDNASKYTPEGGAVAVSVGVSGDRAVVAVRDGGMGIPADALTRIFEPFARETDAADADATGLGLGLAIVRELVDAHGGSVVARSSGMGLGSEFVATFPLSGSA